MITRPNTRSRFLLRLAWFVGIWAASVAAFGLIAYLLRSLIPGSSH
jgi:hypothetical protein